MPLLLRDVPGWPVDLREGAVGVRGIRRRDGREWNRIRSANYTWLTQWEATNPDPRATAPSSSFGAFMRTLRGQIRQGHTLPLVVTYHGDLVGQVTVSQITWGSACSAQMGYWIAQDHAGQGIIPTAVAMVSDHCFTTMGLHRIEINIRPENHASLSVVNKLGFRPEGVKSKFLHIDGQWRDHVSYALTSEDVPDGLLSRWLALQEQLREEREFDMAQEQRELELS